MDRVFNQIKKLFRTVFENMNCPVTAQQLESISSLVFEGMTKNARYFHTPEHIFRLVEEDSPILSLAALFHDLVYYQVDEGFIPQIQDILSLYIEQKNGDFYLLPPCHQADSMYFLSLDVFDFHINQTLDPLQGMNEFLSALVMNKCLEKIVPASILFKASLCIEATIPFRGVDCRGKSPLDILEQRAEKINRLYHFSMSLEEIYDSIKYSAIFANKDVDNFSESDSAVFLENTWKLLPEMNSSLRVKDIYSVKDYRQALLKMEEFLTSLDAKSIFNQYRGVPSDAEYQRRLKNAQTNVANAREYLAIKLVSIAIIEALANLTGGDAPIANFMGNLEKKEPGKRLEDYLPINEATSKNQPSNTIHQLLACGRAAESSFDMSDSPLSLFLYQNMDKNQIASALSIAKSMFKGDIQAIEYLRFINQKIILHIIDACAQIYHARHDRMIEVSKLLK